LTIGSLFSGIGGLEIALESCGLGPVVWQCDSDPHARAVLATHWPNVRRYNDVREIDETAECPDIICGGFPCQNISNAGKREGISGPQSGLWSEFARIIRVLRPRVVFVENVAALAARGLDRVLGDLATLGFDAEWDVLRAADVGAPHLRARLFILAHADGFNKWLQPWRGNGSRWSHQTVAPHDGADRDVAHSDGIGEREQNDKAAAERDGRTWSRSDACGRGWWAAEPDVGRVAHGVPDRAHRLRLLGNSVVPQQAAHAWLTLSARASRSQTEAA